MILCYVGLGSVSSVPVLEGKVPHSPCSHSLCSSCQPALHCTCRTTIPWWYSTFFIYSNVHPVLLISLFFFAYLTATTLSTSFPVSCKELLPKQTPLTSADFKRQKYEVGCFRHIQHFLASWLVCALNECSTLLLHDHKLLDFFSCNRNVFGNERQNLTRRFCHFGHLQENSDTSLALLQHENDPAAQCFSLFNKA